MAVSVPSVATLDTTLTSSSVLESALEVVTTPVTIPFRYPLKVVTVPTPEIETLDNGVVIPVPTKAVVATATFANLD